MEGIVLHYDETTKQGVLKSDNGDRFNFSDNDWKANSSLRTGIKVDFVIKDSAASEIYAVTSVNLLGNIAGKLSDIQGSNVGQKVSALISNGSHNKLGLLASIAVLITIFLPVIEIPFLGKSSLIDDGNGKLLFMLLVVLTIFFYGGATRLYTRVLAGVVLTMLFFQYYDLYSGINQVNGMIGVFGGESRNPPKFVYFIQWGTLANISACMVLFIAAYIKGYRNNENAI